ncbi:MAG: VanZ family protein [Paenibacillus sp.]|jgi:VanZ family protein|nr:VanZ family protein [Paenibacillus sp.]
MRLFVWIAWAAAIFVLTCASDSGFWMNHRPLSFQWVGSPDYAELLSFKTDYASMEMIVRKVGHFISFGLFAVMFVWLGGSRKSSFAVAVLYAVSTEMMQLHFARDGRLSDMMIDTAGIACFLLLLPGRRPKQEAHGRADPGV